MDTAEGCWGTGTGIDDDDILNHKHNIKNNIKRKRKRKRKNDLNHLPTRQDDHPSKTEIKRDVGGRWGDFDRGFGFWLLFWCGS